MNPLLNQIEERFSQFLDDVKVLIVKTETETFKVVEYQTKLSDELSQVKSKSENSIQSEIRFHLR